MAPPLWKNGKNAAISGKSCPQVSRRFPQPATDRAGGAGEKKQAHFPQRRFYTGKVWISWAFLTVFVPAGRSVRVCAPASGRRDAGALPAGPNRRAEHSPFPGRLPEWERRNKGGTAPRQ